MRKSKTLRKLLEKIRGFKTGDCVRYRWNGTQEWHYGRISSVIKLQGEFAYVVTSEETVNLVLIVPKLGDKIQLMEIEGKEVEDRR